MGKQTTLLDELEFDYTDVAAERDELRAENERLRAELERVARCYESATGKPVCGEGDIVRLECKQMTELRTLCDELAELLAAYRASVPLGHQPHMTARKADKALDRHFAMKSTNESKPDCARADDDCPIYPRCSDDCVERKSKCVRDSRIENEVLHDQD